MKAKRAGSVEVERDAPVEESVLEMDASSPELVALTESGRSLEPAVDWSRVESGLFAKLDAKQAELRDSEHQKRSPSEPRAAPAELSSVSRPWLNRVSSVSVLPRQPVVPRKPVRRVGFATVGGLALAATAVLAITQPWRVPSAPVAPSLVPHEVAASTLRALDEQTRDGTDLGSGDAIVSSGSPLALGVRRVDGTTVIRWTLAPESRVVVRSMAGPDGRGQVLALERGAVHADVEPGLGAGAFAVLVEGTRVEVKGTSFRVLRLENRLEVEVDHGVVGVGPNGREASHLLRAPARAAFAFDGGRLSDVGEHQAPPAWVLALKLQAADPKEAPSVPQPLPPAAGTVKPLEKPLLTAQGIRGGLKKCFEQSYPPSSDGSVRLSVVTTLTFAVRADGSVEQAKFDPPLKPEFTQCAQGVVFGRFQGAAPTLDLAFP